GVPDHQDLGTAPVGGRGQARRRPGQPERQLGRDLLAGDAPNAVGAEMSTRHCLTLSLRELRALARLLEAGLLALLDPRVAGEEPAALQLGAQVGIGLDEGAGDAV